MIRTKESLSGAAGMPCPRRRAVVCMAALLATSMLSRVPVALLMVPGVVDVAVDTCLWPMLERLSSRFLFLQMGMAVFSQLRLEESSSIVWLILLVSPYGIDILCQYALLGWLRGDPAQRRKVVFLTAGLRFAAGFLLIYALCTANEPVLGSLTALLFSFTGLLPDTLVWMALALFMSSQLSRRASASRAGKRPAGPAAAPFDSSRLAG